MQFVGRSRSESGLPNTATGLYLACVKGLCSLLAAKGAWNLMGWLKVVAALRAQSAFFPGGYWEACSLGTVVALKFIGRFGVKWCCFRQN